jgi:hypothetical protein
MSIAFDWKSEGHWNSSVPATRLPLTAKEYSCVDLTLCRSRNSHHMFLACNVTKGHGVGIPFLFWELSILMAQYSQRGNSLSTDSGDCVGPTAAH